MKISTQDCKDFISSISHIIGSTNKEKWKRTKKYKENGLILRDFQNPEGRILTICENQGKISLHQIQSQAISLSNLTEDDEDYRDDTRLIHEDWGKKYLGHNAKHNDIAKFLSECVESDINILANNYQHVPVAKNPKSWVSSIPSSEGGSLSTKDWINNWDLNNDNGKCQLHYTDYDGNIIYLKPKNVEKVYVFSLPVLGPSCEISVYETKDHYLHLGKDNFFS